MKATEMKPYIVYRAITTSTDGTIRKGDLLWLSGEPPNLLNLPGIGALPQDEWMLPETGDFEVEKAQGYYVEKTRWVEKIRKV